MVVVSVGCGSAAHAPSAKSANDGGPDAEPDGPACSVTSSASGVGGYTGDGSPEVAPAIACPDPVGFTGADACPAGHGLGVVSAWETTGGPTWLSANFEPPSSCAEETIGPCTVITYYPPSGAMPQAGDITAVSGSSMLTTTPAPSTGKYDVAEFPGSFWTAGTPVTISATGGSLPPFVGGVCGPAPVTITSPVVSDYTSLVIDRNHDLTVQWTGTGPGLVLVTIAEAAPSSNPISAGCDYPVDTMTGVVPKEVLQKFSAGAQGIEFERLVRRTITVGDACLELEAKIPGLNAQGLGLGSLRATFQ
jgi:hypothetical protein